MTKLAVVLSMLDRDQRAVTALEYGLIAAAIIAVGLAGFSVIGSSLADKMNAVAEVMT